MPIYDSKSGTYNFGVVRSATPAPAPQLQLRGSGRERKADLRRYCSPVLNQGQLSSCCSIALVGAMELLEIKSGTKMVPRSSLFLYYNARKISGTQDRSVGVLAAHTNAALMAHGVCEEEVWPYREANLAVAPPAEAYKRAGGLEAIQYARLASTEEAKVSISNGLPVLFSLTMGMGYYEAARHGGLIPEYGSVDNGQHAEHAVLAVGYDDDAQRWLTKNSWGEQFGDKGYLHIPYSVLEKTIWREDLWVVGALEKLEGARLLGPTPREAMAHAQTHGVADMQAAMKALGQDIRQDLEKRTDDARLSMRERLQAQEREIEARRKKD